MLRFDCGTYEVTMLGEKSGWLKSDIKAGERYMLDVVWNKMPLYLLDRSVMVITDNMTPLYFKNLKQFKKYFKKEE